MQKTNFNFMKIGIQTWGSNGDIRPMIALAGGLRQAGHTVTLCVCSIDNRSDADLCRTLSIPYRRVPEHVDFDMPAFAQKTFRMNTLQWLRALLDEVFFPYEMEIYQASRQLAAEQDLLIGHHFLYPLKLAAHKQQKPHISVTFCHAAIPVSSEPPFRFPKLGGLLNRLQWKIMQQIFDFSLKQRLSKLWKMEGVGEIRHVFPDLLSSDLLNLVAVDPVFCREHVQWPSLHKACGFLNLPEDAESWLMPAALNHFMADGEPPVYLTFGSLQQAVPDWSMELFIEAVRLTGCRAIIQTASAHYAEHSIQGEIYFIGRHPHHEVFKRCAAVVHHGGAGTTHAATLSGCPSIVVPFMDEQLFWGCQLQQLGIAGIPLPARTVNAKTLAVAITKVLNSPNMQTTASQLSKKLRSHNGVLQAVNFVEKSI